MSVILIVDDDAALRESVAETLGDLGHTAEQAAEGMRETLFEPFVTGRAGGTGLGPAFSRELASAHGGTLAMLDRAPDGGACLEIALPGQHRR